MYLDRIGTWRELRNRVEIAVYRELRPMVRGGMLRLRVAAAGAVVVAGLFGIGGYWLGVVGEAKYSAAGGVAQQSSFDPYAETYGSGQEFPAAILSRRDRNLPRTYSVNRPQICNTERSLKNVQLMSVCD